MRARGGSRRRTATPATTALLLSLAVVSATASNAHADFTIVGTVAGVGHMEVYVDNRLRLTCTTPADTPDNEVHRCTTPEFPNGEYTETGNPGSDGIVVVNANATATSFGWELTQWGCAPASFVQVSYCLTSPQSCGGFEPAPNCPWLAAPITPSGSRIGIHAEFTDVAAPNTQILAGRDGVVADPAGKHAFTFSSSDPAVGSRGSFECRLDGHLPSGGNWSTCSSPWSEPVSRGSHRFEVRAVDPSGNADATPDSWEWFQQIPPETTIVEGSVGGSAVASANARFRLGPADASFGCRLDEGGWFPCASTPEFGGLADGWHTFEARAGNAFGEVDQTPARRTWRVDTTPPDTAIASGPGDGEVSTSRSALFMFVSEPDARFECRLDTAPFTACGANSHALGELTLGTHTFTVRAVDQAGNADPTPASRVWRVVADITPRIDSAVQNTWAVDRRRFVLLRLKVVAPPRGSTAELRCSGRRCPFQSRRFTEMRNGSITLYRHLTPRHANKRPSRRYLAGQLVEVRVNAPGYIGKVVRYRLKTGRLPVGRALCLGTGAEKPSQCAG